MRQRPSPISTERGSALIMAFFVLVLISSVGIALLFTTQSELRMSQASVHVKEVFYLAEAGEEHGRQELLNVNGKNGFTGVLRAHGGFNDRFDFDPEALQPSYDSAGNLTGLSGYGDDRPLQGVTRFGSGWYAAFLTNDPGEFPSTTDGDRRVMITGVGAGQDRSFEVVQVILEQELLFAAPPPATITILGADPDFDGGTSAAKLYTGNDCSDRSVSVPVVGVIGSDAVSDAEDGVSQARTYLSGGYAGEDTVQDVDGVIDPDWKDCEYWLERSDKVRNVADVLGDLNTPNAALGVPGNPKTVYIEGDYEISGNFRGAGMLWVTGRLTMDGTADWYGGIYVVGTGEFLRNGGGSGFTTGSVVVVDVAGPDRRMWTSDDCSGPDGVPGNSDDGIAPGSYQNNGGGNHGTGYCLNAINTTIPPLPYRIASFLQR